MSEAREQSGEPINWPSHLALSHQQLVSPGDVLPNLQHNLTQTESNISDTNKEIISIVQRANETNYQTPSALVRQTSHENSKHNIFDTVSKTSQMKRKGQGHVILCDIGWTSNFTNTHARTHARTQTHTHTT